MDLAFWSSSLFAGLVKCMCISSLSGLENVEISEQYVALQSLHSSLSVSSQFSS